MYFCLLMEKTNNNTIILNFLKNIFYSNDDKEQLGFLKIWPVFKLQDKLINIWINSYIEICDQFNKINKLTTISGSTFIKKTNLIDSGNINQNIKIGQNTNYIDIDPNKKKNCLLNFLILGLSYNYLQTESKDIFRVMSIMEKYKENSGYINTIKLSVIKFKTDPSFGRKSVSEKTVTEITKIKRDDHDLSTRNNVQCLINNISEINSRELALYITYCFNDIIKNMNIHELLYCTLNDKCDNKYTPELNKLVEIFTKLSYVIPTEILMKCKSKKERSKFIKFILKLGFELKELRNFHALFAIVAGLNHSSIQRIKNLWKKKSKNTIRLNDLENIISPSMNYNFYRNLIKNLSPTDNCIPYLGLITSDIKHLLEQKLVIQQEKNYQINYNVYSSLIKIINTYESINKNYIITCNKSIEHFMSNLVICTSDEILQDLSDSIWSGSTSNISSKSDDTDNSGSKIATYSIGFLQKSTNIVKSSPNIIKKTFTENILKKQDSKVKPDLNESKKIQKDINSLPNKSPKSKNTHLSLNLTLLSNSDNINTGISSLRNRNKKFKSLSIHALDKDIDDISILKTHCIQLWENKHVLTWLRSIGMEEYIEYFYKEDITGYALPELTDQHLKDELHVDKLGHRIKILKSIKSLNTLK